MHGVHETRNLAHCHATGQGPTRVFSLPLADLLRLWRQSPALPLLGTCPLPLRFLRLVFYPLVPSPARSRASRSGKAFATASTMVTDASSTTRDLKSKSFLLLFFKKEGLPSLCKPTRSAGLMPSPPCSASARPTCCGSSTARRIGQTAVPPRPGMLRQHVDDDRTRAALASR